MTTDITADRATAVAPASDTTLTSDIGLLALRVVFGGLIAAHGTQKLFGWFDGPGWRANADMFTGMGYNPGELFGTLAGLTEVVGGLLLVFGFLTPLAGAVVLGTMINAISATWSGGLLTGAGYEMALLFATVATALTFTGSGRFALDAGRSWQRPTLVVSAAAVALAIAAGLLSLLFKTVL